jgi:hypothetical protein
VKLKKTLLAVAMLASVTCLVPPAYADGAPSVKLVVKGVITPGSCTPTFAGGNEVVFNYMGGDLYKDKETLLGEKPTILQITCSAKAAVAFHIKDEKSGTAEPGVGHIDGHGNEYSFGLNKQGDKNIGAYQISISNPKGDAGATIYPLASTDQKAWLKSDGFMKNDINVYIGFANTATASFPQAYQNYTIPLTVHASVRKSSDLDLTKAFNLDGSATFELTYL